MKRRKDLLCLLLISFLILVFFARYLSGKNLFFATDEASSDLLDFYYPQRAYLADHLKQGQIPLWTPYQQNGFPFLAEAQTGVFYPPNLILFRLLPTPLAFNWSIILSYFILSFGTYFFLRTIKLDRLAAFFGSLVITFSGFFIAHLKHVPLLQVATFLPWTLLLTEKIITTYRSQYALGLAFIMALMILPGHLPTAYSIILFALFYFLLRLAQEFKERGEAIKPLVLFFFSLLLSFLLSAIQLLPTLEMIPYSTRNIPLVSVNFSSKLIDQIMMFINPFSFGNPGLGNYLASKPNFWEINGYLGLLPLLLALYAFLKIKQISPFKALLIVSLIFVFGMPRGFFDFLWNFLPGLIFTRIPSRFLLFTDFSLIVLAAFSMQKLIQKRLSEGKTIVIAILLFTVLDLGWYFYQYYGSMSAQKWQETPQSAAFLHQDKQSFRITNIGQDFSYSLAYQAAGGWLGNSDYFLAAKETLPPTLNSLFKIPSVHFQYEYAGAFALSRRSQLSLLTQGEDLFKPSAPKILGLQNVKYLLSMTPLPPEATSSFKLVFETSPKAELPPLTILENPQFLPRAYFVPTSLVLTREKALAFMISSDFNPHQQVILEKNLDLPQNGQGTKKQDIRLVEDAEDRLQFQVETPTSAYFVLTDSFYPGWKAKIDGQETEIAVANYAFRAIPIPAGKHLVEFNYQPVSFYLGALITLLTLIGMVVFFLVNLFKKSISKLLRFSG